MSEFTPKTIQIFLPDGNPKSIKIAEITNRTVKALLIPRSKLETAYNRSEINNVGIYFLFGSSEEDSSPVVYVGEAENVLTRIKQHNRSKDFWNTALVIVSKTKHFTKSHIKFLEWHCYKDAKSSSRYKIENSVEPTQSHISESMQADLMFDFETIKILTSTLGYNLFDEIKKKSESDILICKGKDALAEGQYSEEGLIVFAGSKCNLEESKTAGTWVKGMRQKLIEDGKLIQKDNVFVFSSDHIFSSPSAGAAVVLARRANGWIEWKYKNGKTMDEVLRKK